MRVDVFQFHNEFEMLQCRANELDGLVDMHIAVEGNLTKSGQPRDYVLEGDEIANLLVVRTDLNDISDVVLSYDIDKTIQRPGYTPKVYPYADNWKRDWKQREAIDLALQVVPDDAIVLYGDVDEIPRRSVVEAFDSPVVGVMELNNLLYDVKWTGGTWAGPTIGTKEAYGDTSFAEVRAKRGQYPVIADAGWHLSWFGGREAIFAKVKANAHQEMTDDLDLLGKQYDDHIWPGGTIELWRYEGDLPQYVTEGKAPREWGYREPRAKSKKR